MQKWKKVQERHFWFLRYIWFLILYGKLNLRIHWCGDIFNDLASLYIIEIQRDVHTWGEMIVDGRSILWRDAQLEKQLEGISVTPSGILI
jgi:hypothetical protein